MQVVIVEDTVITSFREEFTMQLRPQCYAYPAVDPRFIYRVGREDLSGRYCCSIESEKRVKRSEGGDAGRGEFLSSAIEATATDQVYIEMTPRREMDDGIQRGREHVNISIGEPDTTKG